MMQRSPLAWPKLVVLLWDSIFSDYSILTSKCPKSWSLILHMAHHLR